MSPRLHNFAAMTQRLLIILYTLLAAATPVFAQTPDNENDYVRMMGIADSAIAEGDWVRAEHTLRAAMQIEPGNPANVLLLSNIGMMQFYQGNDSAAIETLTDACNIAPAAIAVHANRATVLEAAGRHDEAAADCRAILGIDSTNVRARAMLMTHCLRKGDNAGAKAQLDTLTAIAPQNPLTDIAAGSFYSSTGDFTKAIPPLSRAIGRTPQAEYYAARAFCYLMTESLNEASADIAEGLRLDPSEGELYLYRAMLNKMRYRSDEAAADAQRAIKLGVSPLRALPFTK